MGMVTDWTNSFFSFLTDLTDWFAPFATPPPPHKHTHTNFQLIDMTIVSEVILMYCISDNQHVFCWRTLGWMWPFASLDLTQCLSQRHRTSRPHPPRWTTDFRQEYGKQEKTHQIALNIFGNCYSDNDIRAVRHQHRPAQHSPDGFSACSPKTWLRPVQIICCDTNHTWHYDFSQTGVTTTKSYRKRLPRLAWA